MKKKFFKKLVAGVLKTWLKELPEPLFTFDLYETFISAASIYLFLKLKNFLLKGITEEETRIECLLEAVSVLPPGI